MNATIAQSAAFALSVLVNGLWQGALLSAAAWLVLRTVRGTNATTRHAVLVAALAGILVLPIVTTIAAFAGHAATQTSTTRTATTRTATTRTATTHVSNSSPALHPHNAARITAKTPSHNDAVSERPAQASSNVPVSSLAPLTNFHFTLPPLLILIAALAWLVCALVLGARLATSLQYLERLKRDALPLPVDYRARLERWDAALKGTRDVRLCRSSDVTVPIAVGIFDAMILLPDHLLHDLQPEDLDRILLHELAHLRRGDDWINAFERVAEALLFFNPAVRWIVRQLDVEREVACDDWVLERQNEALPYAQCLVKLVERVTWPHQALVAPGVFVTRRSISIRIERLMLKQRDVRLRIAPAPLSAVAVLAIAVCFLGAYVAPSIAAGTGVPAASNSGARLASVPKTVERSAATVSTRNGKPLSSAGAASTARALSSNAHLGAATSARNAAQLTQTSGSSLPDSARTTKLIRPLPAAGKSRVLAGTQPPAALTKQDGAKVLPLHSALNPATHLASNASQSTATRIATKTSQSTSNDSGDENGSLSPEAPAGAAKRVAINSDYISDLAGAGYTNLSVDDLIRLKSLGVTADYIRAMEDIGFKHPSIEDLTRMRALDFTPEYARDIRKVFPSASLDMLLNMRAVGVSSQYVQELRDAGLAQPLTADTVRSLRALDVTAKYVTELRSAGITPLTTESVRRLRAVGVDGAYIKQMADAGYAHLNADQLTQLRAVGVDKAFLDTVRAHGFHNLTLEELVRLRVSGVLTND